MKVWYVSYGSNMNNNRFLTYILGGKMKGSTKVEVGSRNKTLPLKKELFKTNRSIRFLQHSSRWDGSVLFLGETGNKEHYAVRYLIEDEQFIDVLKQENNKPLDSNINITTLDLQQDITKTVYPDSWYSKLLYLGDYEGYKSYTFTCNETMFSQESQQTNKRYLKVILNGINSFDSVDKKAIIETFLEIPGVTGFYKYDDLYNLID